MSTSLSIHFSEQVPEIVQKRIRYIFETFCMFYGYSFNQSSKIKFIYGARKDDSTSWKNLSRPSGHSTPNPNWDTVLGHPFPVFHGKKENIDWLAEAFEWVSNLHEYSITELDSVGRIPFKKSLFGVFEIPIEVPYANLAFLKFNEELKTLLGKKWIQKPIKQEALPLWINIHDIDFLPTTPQSTAKRLFKNLGWALINKRDLNCFLDITIAVIRKLVKGKNPLNYLPTLIEHHKKNETGSSFAFIMSQNHRRDGNYNSKSKYLINILKKGLDQNIEMIVHGSYKSLEKNNLLKEEFKQLEKLITKPVIGNRQHWLKFTPETLFSQLDKIGVRNGAAFPFSPYNFSKEKAYKLVEFPLIIMDGALYSVSEGSKKKASSILKKIIDNTEKYGWGGCSILWHDTVLSGCQQPKYIKEAYWELILGNRKVVSGETGFSLFKKHSN
ncbi:MAG: hypothetical protein ACKVIX_05900 [Sphingomonadales bacterium]